MQKHGDETQAESASWNTLRDKYGPEFVWVCTMPYNGAYLIRMFPAEEFAAMLARGEKPAVSKAVTCATRRYQLTKGGSAAGEIYLHPDWTSAYMNPSLTAKRLELMASWVHKDGTQVAHCPRNSLHRLVSTIRSEHGLYILLGFEVEVVFLSTAAETAAADPESVLHLVEDISRALQRAGVSVRLFHAEAAPNQWEFALGPASPVQAVDRLVRARQIILHVAGSHKWRATFHPRPVATEAGTGAHVHVSVNRCDNEAAKKLDFDSSHCFFAGVLRHLRALCAFTMPLDVSYDRVQSGIWSGGEYVCWGWQNRETPLRRIEGNRFEIKPICGTANPYIALTAILAAGLIGLRDHLHLTLSDCQQDPSQLSPDERQALGICELLPTSLDESLRALEDDVKLRECVGASLTDSYAAVTLLWNKELRAKLSQDRHEFLLSNY